jgi:hypothetical protein
MKVLDSVQKTALHLETHWALHLELMMELHLGLKKDQKKALS